MTNEIRFEFGAPDRQGKRLVKAFHKNELLAQERFDPLQSWQAKSFVEKVGMALPASRFDGPTAASQHVTNELADAVRKLPANQETAKSTAPTASTVNIAEVEPEEVRWLWRQRIALGKLTLLVGDPGLGKSFLSLDLAARVTLGSRWPDCADHAPRGTVILLSAEDDIADTIRPRLDAAGADVSKIVALRAVKENSNGD